MILIAFGSNLPGAAVASIDNLRSAAGLLPYHGIVLKAVSGLYETPPVGPGRQGNYVNAVAWVSSEHGPAALLAKLARVEIQCGRRPGPRWSARVLDLDLLAYGRMVAGWGGDIAALRSGTAAAPRLVIPPSAHGFTPFCAAAPDRRRTALAAPCQWQISTATLEICPARAGCQKNRQTGGSGLDCVTAKYPNENRVILKETLALLRISAYIPR